MEVIKTKIIWESVIEKTKLIEREVRYYKFPFIL